ncbi:hypothetical protein [Mycolicibacterium monacense]
MTESRESGTERAAAAVGERRVFESPSPYDDGRRNRSSSILVWVGIVAGVVFIVAVIFFSGFSSVGTQTAISVVDITSRG